MASKDNEIIKSVLEFSHVYKNVTPEVIIYGFTKLMLMSDSSLEMIFGAEGLAVINEARVLMEKNNLNLNLIKSGMPTVKEIYDKLDSYNPESYNAFSELVTDAEPGPSPVDLLKEALKVAIIPMEGLFKNGQSADAATDYYESVMKAYKSNEDKASRDDTGSKSSDDGQPEDNNQPTNDGQARETKQTGEKRQPGKKRKRGDSEQPDETVQLDKSEQPDETVQPDENAQSDKSVQPDKSEQPDENVQSDKSEQSDESEQPIENGQQSEDNRQDKGDKRDGGSSFERMNEIFGRRSPKNEEETPEQKPVEEDAVDLLTLTRNCNELTKSLLTKIKGQDQAVEKFVRGYYFGEMFKESEEHTGPRATFFFFGPPGVGKTLLATAAGKSLKRPYHRFDMSSYSDHQAGNILLGATKEYGGREGELIKVIREEPNSILLFDEIEKAHINVIRLFLQILSEGVLRSEKTGQDVSFSQAIIIFTSNVGAQLYEDRSVNLSTLPDRLVIDAIKNDKNAMGQSILPPEMCSRIASANTVMFNHLGVGNLIELVNISFEKVGELMMQTQDCRITYSEKLPALFIYSRGDGLDARVATGQSNSFLKNEIYELTKQVEKNFGQDLKLTSIHLDLDMEHIDPELMKLFVNESKEEILVLGDKKLQSVFKAERDKYTVYGAETVEEAMAHLKKDIAAVFIDPTFGIDEEAENALSVTDYNTQGIALFAAILEKKIELPIYIVENGQKFSDADREEFIRNGAVDIITADTGHKANFVHKIVDLLNELYMEKTSLAFSNQGWIISYKTRQAISGTKAVVTYYDFKKTRAIDSESRNSIVDDAERPNVHFEDVIGAKNAKKELLNFTGYLKNPKKYIMSGGVPPKGVLLYGPPGTGKTMLAKALAGESDVTFISTSATEFMSPYVGMSEENIRKLFRRARKYAPSIVFIDEIDAIGKKRTGSDQTQHTEKMLNALLTEMDGFSTNNKRPVFVLAATNYGVGGESDGINSLDEALVRRFDNKIYVDLPDKSERLEYLKLQAAKKKLSKVTDKGLKNVAERTVGSSLAILEQVVKFAIRQAEDKADSVTDDILLNALEEYIYGEKKNHSEDYYKKVAIHETGHAYMNYLSGDIPSYITIESRGNFGGYMQFADHEEVGEYTREDLINRIRIALAGRAAEEVFYGKAKSLNTGASSDLAKATNLAFALICNYGMDGDNLVVLSREDVMRSELAGEYVSRVNEMLNTEMMHVVSVLWTHKPEIKRIADALVKKNHLTGAEFEALVKKGSKND